MARNSKRGSLKAMKKPSKTSKLQRQRTGEALRHIKKCTDYKVSGGSRYWMSGPLYFKGGEIIGLFSEGPRQKYHPVIRSRHQIYAEHWLMLIQCLENFSSSKENIAINIEVTGKEGYNLFIQVHKLVSGEETEWITFIADPRDTLFINQMKKDHETVTLTYM